MVYNGPIYIYFKWVLCAIHFQSPVVDWWSIENSLIDGSSGRFEGAQNRWRPHVGWGKYGKIIEHPKETIVSYQEIHGKSRGVQFGVPAKFTHPIFWGYLPHRRVNGQWLPTCRHRWHHRVLLSLSHTQPATRRWVFGPAWYGVSFCLLKNQWNRKSVSVEKNNT